jgi:hypothetical protein
MIKRKDRSPPAGDVERSRPTVADSIGDELGTEPLIIKLGDLWSDFMQAGESRNTESPTRHISTVPLLDDMKGILQWD